MFALIRWGLWQKRWFILWWCIAIFGLIFINLVFYPSFRDQAAEVEKTFSQIPEGTKSFISDTGDLFSPSGYLSSQVFYLLMPMVLGIMSISLGSSLIGHEERENTIELLLGRPVSRTKLITAKAIIALIIAFCASFVGILTTVIMASIVNLDVAPEYILTAGLASFLLALSFGSIAFLFSSFGKARIASIGVATLIALGGYILVSLIDIASWLKFPGRFFPFYYYHPGAILEGTIQWQDLLIIGLIPVVAFVVSLISFRKRDIVG